MIIMDASGYLTNSKTRNFTFLIYFPRMAVDKTKVKDIHENIDDIIVGTNLVLASNLETTKEAFEEEDSLAVREADQESLEYGEESSLDP